MHMAVADEGVAVAAYRKTVRIPPAAHDSFYHNNSEILLTLLVVEVVVVGVVVQCFLNWRYTNPMSGVEALVFAALR